MLSKYSCLDSVSLTKCCCSSYISPATFVTVSFVTATTNHDGIMKPIHTEKTHERKKKKKKT